MPINIDHLRSLSVEGVKKLLASLEARVAFAVECGNLKPMRSQERLFTTEASRTFQQTYREGFNDNDGGDYDDLGSVHRGPDNASGEAETRSPRRTKGGLAEKSFLQKYHSELAEEEGEGAVQPKSYVNELCDPYRNLGTSNPRDHQEPPKNLYAPVLTHQPAGNPVKVKNYYGDGFESRRPSVRAAVRAFHESMAKSHEGGRDTSRTTWL